MNPSMSRQPLGTVNPNIPQVFPFQAGLNDPQSQGAQSFSILQSDATVTKTLKPPTHKHSKRLNNVFHAAMDPNTMSSMDENYQLVLANPKLTKTPTQHTAKEPSTSAAKFLCFMVKLLALQSKKLLIRSAFNKLHSQTRLLALFTRRTATGFPTSHLNHPAPPSQQHQQQSKTPPRTGTATGRGAGTQSPLSLPTKSPNLDATKRAAHHAHAKASVAISGGTIVTPKKRRHDDDDNICNDNGGDTNITRQPQQTTHSFTAAAPSDNSTTTTTLFDSPDRGHPHSQQHLRPCSPTTPPPKTAAKHSASATPSTGSRFQQHSQPPQQQRQPSPRQQFATPQLSQQSQMAFGTTNNSSSSSSSSSFFAKLSGSSSTSLFGTEPERVSKPSTASTNNSNHKEGNRAAAMQYQEQQQQQQQQPEHQQPGPEQSSDGHTASISQASVELLTLEARLKSIEDSIRLLLVLPMPTPSSSSAASSTTSPEATAPPAATSQGDTSPVSTETSPSPSQQQQQPKQSQQATATGAQEKDKYVPLQHEFSAFHEAVAECTQMSRKTVLRDAHKFYNSNNSSSSSLHHQSVHSPNNNSESLFASGATMVPLNELSTFQDKISEWKTHYARTPDK